MPRLFRPITSKRTFALLAIEINPSNSRPQILLNGGTSHTTPLPALCGSDLSRVAAGWSATHLAPRHAALSPATPQDAPTPTTDAPAVIPATGEPDTGLPAQTSSRASVTEVRAACGAAVKRGTHTEEILDTLAAWCGLTPEGKILTVPAARAELDELLTALR